MNAETLKKPWVIALIVLAAIGLLAVGFFGSRLVLGRQFRDGGFPRMSFGAAPFFGEGERVGGEIVALSGDKLSLESPDGEVFEFTITDDTDVIADGGLEALELGAFAFVLYESADNGTLTALFVGGQPEGDEGDFTFRGPPGSGGRGPGGGRQE